MPITNNALYTNNIYFIYFCWFYFRSPHHYEAPAEIVINGNMYMYPSQQPTKREYFNPYSRIINYHLSTPDSNTLEGEHHHQIEYPSSKRMRIAPPPLCLEGTDGMDRWNPSPPWSDSALQKLDHSQRFSYNQMVPIPPSDRAMVT